MSKTLGIIILSFAFLGCASTEKKDSSWLTFFFDGVTWMADVESTSGNPSGLATHRNSTNTPKLIAMIKHSPYADGECTTCHDFKGSKLKFFLTDPVPALCFNCHTDKEAQFKHFPISAKGKYDCTSCHNAHETKEKHLLKVSLNDLCVTCHDLKSANIQEMLERNGATKEKCLDCHGEPHNPLFG